MPERFPGFAEQVVDVRGLQFHARLGPPTEGTEPESHGTEAVVPIGPRPGRDVEAQQDGRVPLRVMPDTIGQGVGEELPQSNGILE